MSLQHINIIGAGLAGCEAAWQIAKRGVRVKLYEMKPSMHTPAHSLDSFAELVCSNSLRSDQLENAAGLLKEEMRLLDSLIIKCADACRVPAGGALAVDRTAFSDLVTKQIYSNENIEVISEEITSLRQDEINIIATGPLTSENFAKFISDLTCHEQLYFYDAAAPIITKESIDTEKTFQASRYGKGSDDYINCPFDQKQYEIFWNELTQAETTGFREFEKEILFSGCMPVESMAANGFDTLRFGPLKPVGLINPLSGIEPYAVVQLRQDNAQATLYNLVGFQTHLKWPEQKRVFSLIPGLEKAEFVRFGVMHRNTYINSPNLLDDTYCMKKFNNIFFAGQITGVEGYVESASSGLTAGINAALRVLNGKSLVFPKNTAIGALANYVSSPVLKNFQPMNVNFGIIDSSVNRKLKKAERNLEVAKASLSVIRDIITTQPYL